MKIISHTTLHTAALADPKAKEPTCIVTEHPPGTEVDVDDAEAEGLIARGLAKRADAPPDAPPARTGVVVDRDMAAGGATVTQGA